MLSQTLLHKTLNENDNNNSFSTFNIIKIYEKSWKNVKIHINKVFITFDDGVIDIVTHFTL